MCLFLYNINIEMIVGDKMFQYLYFEKIDNLDKKILIDVLKSHVSLGETEFKLNENTIVFYFEKNYNIYHLIHDILSETLMNTKVYISPQVTKLNIEQHISQVENFRNIFNLISKTVITNLDLLIFITKQTNSQIKKFIFGKYLMNPVMLETLKVYFLSNQNSIISSKTLYLHRNTLLQRLDAFESYTGLNPKNFLDAHYLFLSLF